MRSLSFLLSVLLLLAACGGLPTSGEVLLEPDDSRTGTEGGDGPRGVARIEFRFQARVTEAVAVEVTYPANTLGTLDGSGVPYPAVVLIQGGAVEVKRYQWLATHLASRGYVVVAPHHAADLAILERDNAALALGKVRGWAGEVGNLLSGALDPLAPVAIAGHSLGGVVSAMNWVEGEEDYAALALFASYAAAGTDVEAREGTPVLSLVGSEDGKALPDEVESEFQRFADPAWFGVVEGMNHYGWTDDPTALELSGDGAASRPVEEVRIEVLNVLDAFLDSALRGTWKFDAWLSTADLGGVEMSP